MLVPLRDAVAPPQGLFVRKELYGPDHPEVGKVCQVFTTSCNTLAMNSLQRGPSASPAPVHLNFLEVIITTSRKFNTLNPAGEGAPPLLLIFSFFGAWP